MSAGKSWVHERCGMVSERGLLHMGNAKERIESGKAVLGIEFGSTRIKAVLVDETHQPIASGAHDWENQLVDGIWTSQKKLNDTRQRLRAAKAKHIYWAGDSPAKQCSASNWAMMRSGIA